MSSSTNRYKSNQPPPLPTHGANPSLPNYKGKIKSVRTQAITLGPTSTITIARIKIPSPDKTCSHLIKRFDTNAISATSFFKCAFPLASEEDEDNQMQYLDQIYDTHSAGALALGPDHKLTGTWVPIEYANELAEVFGLTLFAAPLIAFPDPDAKTAVATSPTVSKKETEQQNEPSNQPTPQGKSTHQSKPVANQTPTAVRSTKRSKVAPPSFGNTSPSNFNLTSLSKPTHDSKKIDTQNLSGGGSVDGVPTSATTNRTVSPTNSTVDDRSQQKRTAPEGDLRTNKNGEKTNDQLEKSSQESKKLIGTDEEVLQAKEEARKLVSSLKSSSSTTQEKNKPDLKDDDNNPTTNSKTSINRKRSHDEVLEEDQSDETADTDSSPSLIRSSFLKKAFWRRSNQQSDPLKKRVFHKKKDVINTTESTGDRSVEVIDSKKRNLAIAGIFIAGAAASIVPYFF